MTSPLDNAPLQDLYLAGETLLLPHGHAARLWRSRLLTPPAHPIQTRPPLAWGEWTTSLWADLLVEGHDDRLLLNRLQEERVWSDIITAHPPGPPLSPSATRDLATLARSALGRAASFRIPHRLRAEADTVDARAFAHWLGLFLDRCRRDRLLATSLLEDALVPHLRDRAVTLPRSLHLVGFEQITPGQTHLLDELTAAGVTVSQHPLRETSRPGTEQRQAVELPDKRAELRFAVRVLAETARKRSAQAADTEDQAPRFALICPDPHADRHELERLFRELLTPELEPVSADLSSTPWHFATETPLGTVPLVADALSMLRWTTGPLGLERIGQLLLSPFFTFTDSPESRARFDLGSSRDVPALRGTLDLAGFLARPRQASRQPATPLASFPELRTLHRAVGDLGPERSVRSAADWTEAIRKLLQTVGWPGPRTLSPAEFRAVQAWDGLLDLLATLHFDGSTLGFAATLDLLAAEAAHLPAPACRLDVPVQVLTLAQAEALTFDLAIHLDATDSNLPSPERRHPLLPQALQRSLGIGEPGHTLARGRAALDSLGQRSGTLLLLAPLSPDGGSQLTPLCEDLRFECLPATHLLPEEVLTPPVFTEPFGDPETIPLLHAAEVPGGAEVLRLQAACGFRAFATYRLGADDTPARALGIDFREGGSLLHTALELLWRDLRTHTALKELSQDERRELARRSVAAAAEKHHLKAPADDPWAERYLYILRRRFTNLLARWLEIEAERSPFTVLAQEQKQTLQIGPIRLSLRPDRIDEVAGGQILVDYKTSFDLSSKHWLDERPDAPQLPAYALGADPETLKGIAFAQIRPGDTMGWISLTEAAGPFPRKRNKLVDMSAQLEAWHTELTTLAQAFAEGRATVDPKSYPQTCNFCAHKLFCRLDPATLLAQEDEEDEPAEEETLG